MTDLTFPVRFAPLKFSLVAASLLLAGVQTSLAQSSPVQWTIGNGTMRLVGCYAAQNAVQCDIVYTLVNVQAGLLALQADDASYTTTDGTSGDGSGVSIEGGALGPTSRRDSFAGKPLRATFRLPLPASTTSLRSLDIVGHHLTNVSVARSAPSAKPAATPPSPPAAATISGTIRAAGDLYGAVVAACVRQNGGCVDGTLKYTEVSSTGPQATFSITGLDRSLHYTVFAWLDVNRDGDINAGDLLGKFGADDTGMPVLPPHAGTDFTITPVN